MVVRKKVNEKGFADLAYIIIYFLEMLQETNNFFA